MTDKVRRAIVDGVWAVGGRIPPEPVLAGKYGVSINTVRRAVGNLVDDGILERRQGSGTYVLGIPLLPGGEARLVGMLVPSTAYFYPRIIQGAERTLSASNVSMLLTSSEYSVSSERDQIARLVDSGVEGLILVPNLHLIDHAQRYVDGLRELPVPFVLAERKPPEPAPDDSVSYVVTDHAAGAYTALRHLHELGHRRIGFLGRERTGTSDPIAAGFEAALVRLGLKRIGDAVVRRPQWGAEEITDYLDRCRASRITAVFCHGDEDAARLVSDAKREGLTVPGDLAVIAYDDEVAHLGDTPLTSVAPPKAEVGSESARLLLQHLSEPTFPPQRTSLLPRLIVRASSGSASAPRAPRA
ncbi:MAG: substrate-binding domain-containing protein [Microbacterium sp.]